MNYFKRLILFLLKKISVERVASPGDIIFSPVRNEIDLTIVGVGPGDPSLLTLAAVSAIQNATLVAYPISHDIEKSMAENIASSWIQKKTKRLPLLFPMVSEVQPRIDAWEGATKKIFQAIDEGEKVVFLAQGDVSLFSTSSYILLQLRKDYPQCSIKIIPGINSFSAAAAVGKLPLALQNEQLLILPTPDKSEDLKEVLIEAKSNQRVLVLMKLGKKWLWLRPLLDQMKLLDMTLFVKRVGFPDERVVLASKVNENQIEYFSLLIIRQDWPDVIP